MIIAIKNSPIQIYCIVLNCCIYIYSWKLQLILSANGTFFIGNFYGLAEQRIKEFRASCENLGISQENIICLDSFEDDPKVLWQKQAVAQVIADYTDRLNCATIFTFDQFGISGHLNHISTFTGVK